MLHEDCTGHPQRIATVGVGYNGSSTSVAALAVGRELAAAHGARICALEVVCPTPTLHEADVAGDLGQRVDLLLLQARDRLAHLDGVDGCAVFGLAAEELAAFGEEVDLLVVGLGGRGPEWHLLIGGSTSDYLERHARCPVLVVPRPVAKELPCGRIELLRGWMELLCGQRELRCGRMTWVNSRGRIRRAGCR